MYVTEDGTVIGTADATGGVDLGAAELGNGQTFVLPNGQGKIFK